MNVDEYRGKTRKVIVCPSGLELEIRKTKAVDYLRLGILPSVFAELGAAKAKGDRDKLEEIASRSQGLVEKIQKMVLVSAVIPRKEFRIVDKPVYETVEGEISWEEIEADDADFIMDEVRKFSQPTEAEGLKGGIPGDDLEKFQEEQVPTAT